MIKKLSLLFFLAFAMLLSGCKKDLPIDFNPKGHKAPVQINFTEPDLFPEDLAYDPLYNRFYVSSVTHGGVGIIKFDGTYSPFITDEILTAPAA